MNTASAHVKCAVFALGPGKSSGCTILGELWKIRLRAAQFHMQQALAAANREGRDPRDKSAIFRMSNWIGAELRRLPQ